MTIVFFWTGVSSPLAACWRALAAKPGVRLIVYLELPDQADTAYRHEPLLAGVEHRIRRAGDPFDRRAFAAEVAALEPDVCVVLGWRSRMCRAAAESPALAAIPKIFAFDMVYTPSLRKLLAPIVLRKYLRRFRLAFVPGERSAAYARHLGFPEAAIEKGLVGIDMAPYEQAQRERQALPAYPRRFLYVGRYVRDKAIDVLVAGYRRYRERVAEPWPLTCCGIGPESGRLAGVEGIENLGFVQPADLPAIYGRHGAFVLASRVEVWGFVLMEAVAAGLPVVCTRACGASVELVRSYFNGQTCEADDVAGLAAALEWMHAHEAELSEMGARGVPLAAAYATDVWVGRVVELCSRVSRAGCEATGRR
jgi:glycosyltransferase involved in cell wall biosynthesis